MIKYNLKHVDKKTQTIFYIEFQKVINTSRTFYRVIPYSFKNKALALEKYKELFKMGFESYTSYEKGYYKVVAGAFSNKHNAKKAQNKLTKEGIDSYLEVHMKITY